MTHANAMAMGQGAWRAAPWLRSIPWRRLIVDILLAAGLMLSSSSLLTVR